MVCESAGLRSERERPRFLALDASPFDGLPRTWTVPMGLRANGIHLVDILVGPVFKSGVSGIFDTM